MTGAEVPTTSEPSSQAASRPIGGVDLLAAVLLALVTFVVFARATANQFINYDDPLYVSENPYVREGLTLRSIAWALRDAEGNYYHPVASLGHIAVGHFFGMDPAPHKAYNVALHAMNAALVFLLLRRMTGARWESATAAALFALHPLRVEPVAWTDSSALCCFLALIAMHGYVTYVRRTGWRAWTAYAVLVIGFALALLTKPVVITLPFVLLLLDAWPLQRAQPILRIITEKLPLLVIAGAVIAGVVTSKSAGGELESVEQRSPSRRISDTPLAYVDYMRRTVWPTGLAVVYPRPVQAPVAVAIAAATLLVGLSLVTVLYRRTYPWLSVGWLWFLGALVPFTGIVQLRTGTLADRYTYFPQIGLFIVFGWGATTLARRWNATMAVKRATLALLIVLALLTYRQIGFWQDSATLFAHALEVTRDNAVAHHQYANALVAKPQASPEALAAAESHYREALRIRPEHARTSLNLGRVLARQGRLREAEVAVANAVRIDPTLPTASETLAEVRRRLSATMPPATRPTSTTFSIPPPPL